MLDAVASRSWSFGAEAVGADRYVVTGRLTGDVRGGTADLRWDCTVAGARVSRLVIAP